MNIKSFREREPSEMGYSFTFTVGKYDGEEFRMVEATMEDGSTRWLFASNSRPGFFKQVFVPWNLEHPDIISA